ncbi:hypothetical protein M405DRAFT_938335 [Rhizopogon salebrosus TDB-379]|nr:hypothetical protein M405DRAFT_938335 [Rhizopogon salebrosus TDB-379]
MFTRLSSAILYALLIVTSTIASTAAAAAAVTSIQWNSDGGIPQHGARAEPTPLY